VLNFNVDLLTGKEFHNRVVDVGGVNGNEKTRLAQIHHHPADFIRHFNFGSHSWLCILKMQSQELLE
jgi:hypothetical protein